MPYEIKMQGGQHCVVKQGTGESVKCHDSHTKAESHLAALYANEPEAREADPLNIDCAMGSSLL